MAKPRWHSYPHARRVWWSRQVLMTGPGVSRSCWGQADPADAPPRCQLLCSFVLPTTMLDYLLRRGLLDPLVSWVIRFEHDSVSRIVGLGVSIDDATRPASCFGGELPKPLHNPEGSAFGDDRLRRCL